MQGALQTFHKYKKAFLSTGARRGKNRVLDHFRLPKLYNLHIYDISIRAVGTPGQYSTEFRERAHIPLAKDLYRATNKKDWGQQICHALDRKE